MGFAAIRRKEIVRVVLHRNGPVLPDNDAGRHDLRFVLWHTASLQNGNAMCSNFCDLWAPWLRDAERLQLLADAATRRPPRLSADDVAREFGVTLVHRRRLNLKTIGAIDCDSDERKRRRRERQKECARAKRRAKGVKPRCVYLAAAICRRKPWEAAGIRAAHGIADRPLDGWHKSVGNHCLMTGETPVPTHRAHLGGFAALLACCTVLSAEAKQGRAKRRLMLPAVGVHRPEVFSIWRACEFQISRRYRENRCSTAICRLHPYVGATPGKHDDAVRCQRDHR